MNILIIPDSYKGTLSSLEAGLSIKEALSEMFSDALICSRSVSDGGEGFLSMVQSIYQNAKRVPLDILDTKLEKLIGSYILRIENEAFIESALCCGYHQIEEGTTAANASSYPLGQAIRRALDDGANTIHIGIGGTITNDFGIGVLACLGAKFFSNGHEIDRPVGKQILKIDRISLPRFFPKARFIVHSDVSNPLYGENGATMVFGKQKGLSDEEREVFDQKAKWISSYFSSLLGVDKSSYPGAGSGGGIGYMAMECLNAELSYGSDFALNNPSVQKAFSSADLIVTGEGETDAQSRQGKIVGEIYRRAMEANKKIIIVSGSITQEARRHFSKAYFIDLSQIFGVEESMGNPSSCLEKAILQLRGDLTRFALC